MISKKKLFELKPILDRIVQQVEIKSYIHDDPVQFLHSFEDKADQEIAGFFAAIMAWGHRTIVNNKVAELLQRMNHKPAHFIKNFDENSISHFDGFKHRTFKQEDFYWYFLILNRIYNLFGDFEGFWKHLKSTSKAEHFVQDFHTAFFELAPETPKRSRKHIADGRKKSTCKRLLLYLRWVTRKDSVVDVGMMNFCSTSELIIPFDVHVARVARSLNLIDRTQDDWKALMELHSQLVLLDPLDPSKYDYALFGIGVMKLNPADLEPFLVTKANS